MKKIWSIVFSVVFLFTCLLPVGAGADGEAAPDTPAEPEPPKPISTAAEFEAMDAKGSYYLTCDIDFGGKSYDNFIIDTFDGTLDGKGHSLLNFSLKSGETPTDSGIFKYLAVYGNASIQNLTIGSPEQHIQANFTDAATCFGVLCGAQNNKGNLLTVDRVVIYADLTVNSTAKNNVGGFFGASQKCMVTNCELYGSVTAKTTNSWVNAAGFSANPKNISGCFENCRNYADITVYQSTTARAGGFFGYTGFSVTAKNCINYGSVSLKRFDGGRELTNARLGGITAENYAAEAIYSGCMNFGAVSSPIHAGGIIGYNCRAVTVANCVNYGQLTAEDPEKPAGAIYGATERDVTASGNKDKTGALAGEVSDAIEMVGTQSMTPDENGMFRIRFLSTVDSVHYSSVGYEVDVYYDQNGTLTSARVLLECSHVYDSVYAQNANRETVTVTAAELGGNSIAAISLLNVPSSEEYGNITLVCRPFVKNGEGPVYGAAAVCVYSEGQFLFADVIPQPAQ